MPALSDFTTTSRYFHVLYHELTHATGHRSRLNRVGITGPILWASERYSKEELIAELGSCFLMTIKGLTVDATLEDGACYINHWMERLRDDKKLVVEAAAQAQRAVDYILML